MSEKLMNTETKLTKIKRQCTEQFWLVLLFAPLLFVAILVSKQYLPEAAPVNAISAKEGHLASSTSGMQVTSTELAAIIAKPIDELVLTEVYFKSQNIAYSKQATFNINFSQLGSDSVSMKQSRNSLANSSINLMGENS